MNVFLIMLVIFITFFIMEFVAFFMHKYVMHTFLWRWHKDHHQPTGRQLQKNDLFFLIFAIPSWLCVMFGMIYSNDLSVTIGVGIALYGLCYVLVHEIFIHQRIKLFKKTNSRYFKGIRLAHKIHHKNRNKEGGTCFGMLIVPKKYFK